MKKAIISVINDLVTDQRVHRNCMALKKAGYEVLLIGRELKNSLPMNERPYQTKRMKLWFEKGAFFYAEYNIRLFFYLRFQKANLYFANDLDTIPAMYLENKLRGKSMIYDSHEYFTEMPELVDRRTIHSIWKFIEKHSVPKIKHCITVNESIANLFNREYNTDFKVIRNIPRTIEVKNKSRKELGLDVEQKIVLLQGAGINMDRGAEELVEAVAYFDEDIQLLIIGGGEVIDSLRMKGERFKEKIRFIPKQIPEKLAQYTRVADLGISIDKDTNINYRYSLPNKLFDYLHAGIPVLCTRLDEIEKIVLKYQVGDFIESHQPTHIATKINEMMSDPDRIRKWKANTQKAKEELNWELEEQKLINIINEA